MLVAIGIGAVIIIAFVFLTRRNRKFNQARAKINMERYERVKPLHEKLQQGIEPDTAEISKYAGDLLTRLMTFQMLDEFDKVDLFPKEYDNIISASETYLCNWLEFPTELDACPDEIEHLEEVTFNFNGKDFSYHVFKYSVNEPHWAAKDGWMLGVVGPYFEESLPYDHPPATFSRIKSKFGEVNPKDEAEWVHKNISLRRR